MFVRPSLLTAACADQIREVFAVSGSGGRAVRPVCEAELAGLRNRLAQVPDPRRRNGRRHSPSSILLIVLCAPAADDDGYTTIRAWAVDAPPEAFSATGVRFEAVTGTYVVPGESTLRSVIGRIDPVALAAAQSAYLSDLHEGRAQTRSDTPELRLGGGISASVAEGWAEAAIAEYWRLLIEDVGPQR